MRWDPNLCAFLGLVSTQPSPAGGEPASDWQDEGKERWDKLCEEFADVFAEPTEHPNRDIEHYIKLHDESLAPPKPRQYRMLQAELDEVRTQLESYLSKGWVRPSSSSWGAPVIFVHKKDGSMRMCIDYRMLN